MRIEVIIVRNENRDDIGVPDFRETLLCDCDGNKVKLCYPIPSNRGGERNEFLVCFQENNLKVLCKCSVYADNMALHVHDGVNLTNIGFCNIIRCLVENLKNIWNAVEGTFTEGDAAIISSDLSDELIVPTSVIVRFAASTDLILNNPDRDIEIDLIGC